MTVYQIDGETFTINLDLATASRDSLREHVAAHRGRAGKRLAADMGEDHAREYLASQERELARMDGVIEAVRAGEAVLPKHLHPYPSCRNATGR